MRLTAILTVCCVFAVPAGAGENWPPTKKLDAYFDALAKNQFANGTIAISEKGVLVYQHSVGFAKIENGVPQPADAGTRYRVGLVSKLFTAVLTMQLVEGASITLDSKLAEFFPDLPNALDITYRDLLQHRSGLANYSDTPDFESLRLTSRTHADLLKLVASGGARFKPRERVEYSNSNYLLLGYVLEKVYEKSYDDIVRRQIIDKIGLPRTYYAGEGITNLESISYVFTPNGWAAQQDTDPSIHGGAGGMVSTAADLVRLIDMLFAGKILTEHSLDSMRNQDGGSGMGLWPYQSAGQTGYGHGGRIDGFRACVYYFPAKDISIAYTTNASLLSMDEIVDQVLRLIFERGKPPAFEPVKLATRQQGEYLGTWRSADGMPMDSPFRQFKAQNPPIVLEVTAGADAPTVTIQDHEFKLTALGDHEFFLREIGYFLRFYPHENELVVRGPEWDYYLKRDR